MLAYRAELYLATLRFATLIQAKLASLQWREVCSQ